MSTLKKAQKTPIRYAGGKSRALKQIFEYQPTSEISEFREPFLGGGSMAIEFTRRYPDTPVWVNDAFYELYCFWITLQESPVSLTESLLEAKSTANGTEGHRDLHAESRHVLENSESASVFDIAKHFFIVNKCGFSGLMSAGFSRLASEQNFSVRNINNLPAYGKHIAHWKITNLDYSELLTGNNSAWIYLDPPYAHVGKDGKSFIYGKKAGEIHKEFNHERFCDDTREIEGNALISYDNNPLIKSMYHDWHDDVFDLTYTLHSGKAYRENEKDRKELLLRNYER